MNPKQRLKSWQRQGILISSYEEYELLYNLADGKCEACGRELAKENGNTEIPSANLDHDHRNGEPKGILCSRCNRVIGDTERYAYQYQAGVGSYLIKRQNGSRLNETSSGNDISQGGKKK